MLRFLTFCFVVVQTSCASTFCNKDMVEQAWKICEQTYDLSDGNGTISATEMCKNIECFIQCRKDAVGDCDKNDTFLDQLVHKYDTEKWKVYFRAVCSNIALANQLISAGNDACQSNTTCSPGDIDGNLLDLYNKGQYAAYKELLCSTFAKGRSCVSVKTSENCTSEGAKFYQDVVMIGSSVSVCDNADIHDLYSTYGGDAMCVNPKVESNCFSSNLMSKVSKCLTLSIQSITDQPISSTVSQFCDSLECNIKCYTDAIGDCYQEDKNLRMDPTVIKVSNRAACDKKEEVITAIQECEMRNMSCYTELENALTDANALLGQQNYSAYRTAVCSATSKFRDCVDYVPEGNCTNEMASLLKDIMEVTYSYAKCGAQDHAYFNTYADDINCVISAGGTTLTNTLLFCFSFLLVFFV